MTKLVMADTRSENAEMDIGRLNVRIDKVINIIMMVMIIMTMVIMMMMMMMMFNIGRLNARIDEVSKDGDGDDHHNDGD